MSEEESSSLRALNIIVGIGLLVMAIMAVVFTDIAVLTILLIIAAAIVIMGVPRLINGATNKALETKVRLSKFVVGFIAIFIGVLTIIWASVDPTISIEWLILLLAAALIILGFGRFFRGIRAKEFPTWLRVLILGIGALTMALALVLFVSPPIDPNLNILLLAVILLVNGIARLAIGIVSSK